jgi:signal transduction histidine kinase
MALSPADQISRYISASRGRLRWSLADLPDPARLAPVITVESVLLWIVACVVVPTDDVPEVVRLGALGVAVAVWVGDFLTGRRLPRLIFAAAASLPIGFLVSIGAAGIAPIQLLLLVGWIAYTERFALSLGVLGIALAMLRPDRLEPDIWLPWSIVYFAAWAVVRVMLPQQRQSYWSAAAERRRLAREVHDVVSHSMSVTMLHLTGARHALSTDPQAAAAALAEAERLGRASLADLRRTMRLLAADQVEETPLAAPDIRSLVAEYRRAGMDVCCEIVGEAARLSAAMALGLYRIAEEALANATRHAPGGRVQVRLTVDAAGGAHLRVIDDGAADSAPPVQGLEGAGMGIAGMRERAGLLAGSLAAGPRGAGWCVECVLPPASGARLPSAV